jgi:phage-related baseplate assembly protein
MSYTPIDLSSLPAPTIVESLDYAAILQEMVDDLKARDPGFTAIVESDPAFKILEVCAYREMLIRQRVNDAARGVMLAYATGADLDQLGAIFGTSRKILVPAAPTAIPPRLAVMETDTDFRYRVTLALEGLSTAGPEGSYLYHALKVAGVKHATIVGPPTVTPGNVLVTVLGLTGNGAPSATVISNVTQALNAESVRPLTDAVTVQGASIQNYTITATIFTFPGPDSSVVMAEAQASAQEFATQNHKVGNDINRSAIFAALHVDGVQKVTLTSPSADITCNHTQAPFCTAINLTYGGLSQ